MILGLVGGVGSGKSTVTQLLKNEFGYVILHTDDIAKELERPGNCCYSALTEYFGERILQNGIGSPIDNPSLARLIYSDPDALSKVNEIVHPMVWDHVEETISRLRKETGSGSGECRSHVTEKTVSGGAGKSLSGVSTSTMTSCGVSKHIAENAGAESTGQLGAGEMRVGAELRVAVETALPDSRFRNMCDRIIYIYTDIETRIRRLEETRGYSRDKSISVIEGQMSNEEFKRISDAVIDNSGSREKTAKQMRRLLSELAAAGGRTAADGRTAAGGRTASEGGAATETRAAAEDKTAAENREAAQAAASLKSGICGEAAQ